MVSVRAVVATAGVVAALGAATGAGLVSVAGDGSTLGSSVDSAAGGDSAAPAVRAVRGPGVDAMLSERIRLAQREGPTVSRGDVRPVLHSVQRAAKVEAMPVSKQALSGAVTQTVRPSDPRDLAMSMLADYGWSSDQFSCLDQLYLHESGWNPSAENSSSGAFGIPQALPGDKMAAYGADWQTNPETQLKWGLAYIRDSYGSPCGAWGFWESNQWY